MAENEAQRLQCRILQTGEQPVWLRMKLKGPAVECCRLESRDSVSRFSFFGWGGSTEDKLKTVCTSLLLSL